MEKKYPLTFGQKDDSTDSIPQKEATRTEQLRRVLFYVSKDSDELGTPVKITIDERKEISDVAVVKFEEEQ